MESPPAAHAPLAWTQNDYVIRVFSHPAEVESRHWQALLAAEATQGRDTRPFATPTYWAALQDSGSAIAQTGWQLQLVTVWSAAATHPASGDTLLAASPLYVKAHSYGEYVFDWAWAEAYARHGLAYYPKAVVAVPFTPVPGPRLLATDATARTGLLQSVLTLCRQQQLSSLHLLFADKQDLAAAQTAGLMLRHTVQFHWHNRPASHAQGPYADMDDFLASLTQEKRKKIRQERRKVAEAGIQFRTLAGADITPADWDFFYTCYERTYLEHGNAPYLTRSFFHQLAQTQAAHWVMFVAHRADGQPIASSLIAVSALPESADNQNSHPDFPLVAFGRYWGAVKRVDCLHFEACYYQPIAWCIAHGYHRFEGGAQGEHKMARALLPVRTSSAHWLAHPAFAEAVDRYLQREHAGMDDYLAELESRSPLRAPPSCREQ